MSANETGSVRIGDGQIIVRDLAGREWEIDVSRTQLVQARGEAGAIEFITDIMVRYRWDVDSLTMANLIPVQLKTVREKYLEEAAAKAQVDGTAPRTAANKRDRRQQEKTAFRYTR